MAEGLIPVIQARGAETDALRQLRHGQCPRLPIRRLNRDTLSSGLGLPVNRGDERIPRRISRKISKNTPHPRWRCDNIDARLDLPHGPHAERPRHSARSNGDVQSVVEI